ncbi:MAG: penicillin-binding protein 1C [Proteobacteria bacterium]|nr:penicillin-binding protein 1C [Pseudomonadota bacterium]
MKKGLIGAILVLLFFSSQIAFVWIPCSSILEDTLFSTDVYDTHGTLLRLTLAEDDIYRIKTPLSEISPLLTESTLLYEDEYFFLHLGVNPVALAKAFYGFLAESGGIRGASTITMQLARLLYGINSRTPLGKLHQIARAVQLEFHHSKEEILEAYLNLVPYGFNIEGIGAASLIYYKKSPSQLSLLEALTLAVIPQSPSNRVGNRQEAATIGKELRKYRNRLLDKWIKKHPQNIDKSIDFGLDMKLRRPWELPFHAPHFVTQLLRKSSNGGKVETTLDLNLQHLFARIAANYIQRNKSLGVNNTMAVLLNHKTMEVLAHLGSVDFYDRYIAGQVNGPLARRSPGSSLKPFVYGLGLDQGIIHPATVLKDVPFAFGTYKPKNFDKNFTGPVAATEALYKSRNIPALYVSSKLSNTTLYRLMKDLGFPLHDDPKYYGLSIVLGSAEVTMYELVELYAALANGGEFQRLKVLENEESDPGRKILSPEASYLVLDMLSQNPFPVNSFSSKWLLRKKNIAWKTGTSWGFRDAWATGVFGDYVLSVWIGNFSGKSNPVFVGRTLAGPLLFELIDGVLHESVGQAIPFKMDSALNLNEVEVCSISGLFPGPHCRHNKRTLFIPGKSPIDTCTIHRQIEIDVQTGLRSCLALDRKTEKKVFEIWPSDMQTLFKMAGMPRKLPPRFHPACSSGEAPGKPPKITSPQKDVIYTARFDSEHPQTIPLAAITDGDARSLLWFVDEQYLGKVEAGKALIWNSQPGNFSIRATDNLGRTASIYLTVKLVK